MTGALPKSEENEDDTVCSLPLDNGKNRIHGRDYNIVDTCKKWLHIQIKAEKIHHNPVITFKVNMLFILYLYYFLLSNGQQIIFKLA